jgi:CUE domain
MLITPKTLRKAYCPPIEDATFYAISLDYELPAENEALVAILDSLKAAAIVQENTDFDPSGTGGSSNIAAPRRADSRTTPEERSTSNDVTSITTDLTDLNLKEAGCVERSLEKLPLEDQQQWLKDLFPSVDSKQVEQVLKGCASLEQAVDELLNFAFLEEDRDNVNASAQPVPKGIDGFAEDLCPQQRKGRSKRKTRTNESSRASSAGSFGSDAPSSPNVWSTAAEDVEFICSRTSLQPHTVRSVYHANGARLSTTIRALADKQSATWSKLEKVDSVFQMQVAEVKIDLEFIPDAQVYGLLTLARNIPSAARELLEAMTTIPEPEITQRLRGLAQYAPPDLGPKNQQPDPRPNESWTTASNGNTRQLATVHGLAASQAFSQASAAYKRSKSDRLMGGAAAYYASVGHENLKAAKNLQAAEAIAHVAAQSSSTVLDLHGVSVADATRIARDRTRSWWDGLGDAKFASGGGGSSRSGFRIVTGVGSHSKNHAPRIGPAVTKMLVREGWKVEVGHGELYVTGKARK